MDDALLDRAQTGDADALRALYERHAGRVFALVRRLAGDQAQAEDWAQEVWLRAFRALPEFRRDARFSTWLHRIAVNVALHGRRGEKRREARIDPRSAVPERAGPTEHPLLRMHLDRAIDLLPRGMRNVLVLHDVEGYTHEEIGELLGISPGTCKSQLFKARGKLREILEPSLGLFEGETACNI